ncbi:MAG: DUF2939 domain-containing protein [Caulobacteraceae bacterium]
MKPLRPLIAALMALALASCASVQRVDAAGDVHALLIAIRDDDRVAFDAHVDKPALKAQLESLILNAAEGRDGTGQVRAAAAVLSGPLAQVAGDFLLRPRVFRTVAEYYGYRPDKPIPNQIAIAGALRYLRDGTVCAARTRDGPCLLTFARTDGVWRLVRFDGDPSMLTVGR